MEGHGLRGEGIRTLILSAAGAALAVRLIAILALPSERLDYPDTAEYRAVARHLLDDGIFVDDGGFRARRPPLYPWLLALHGASPSAARWTQALLGSAAAALVALLGFRLSPRIGWTAGLAFAAHPLLAFTSVASVGEAAWVPFAVAELVLLAEALERRSWLLGLGAGAAGGLASLGHAGHLPVFLLLGAGSLGWWGRPWRIVLAYAALAALLPGAWMARNAAVLGGFAPLTTKAGFDLYEAFGPQADGGIRTDAMTWPPEAFGPELEADRALRSRAFAEIAARPGRALALSIRKAARFWSPVPNFAEYQSAPIIAATLVALVPTTLGFLVSLPLARRWPKPLRLAGLAVAFTAALHLVFIGSIRYRLTVEPFVLVIAVWGATARSWIGGSAGDRGTGTGSAKEA